MGTTAMRDETIAIKGNKDGLLIEISETHEWALITSDLAARLDQQSAFYAGARVTLDVGTRPVRKDELSSIRALFERRGMTLAKLQSESATSIDAAIALDLRANLTATPANASAPETADGLLPFKSEEDGTVGVMIRRTLRSGRTVHSSGHVVIFGDVNAGAEIIAVGDVVVWGRLRGNVHAGANGDETAVVCALDMTPNQLRIASYISVSPAEKRHKPKPEMASIKDGHIIVETWG